MRRSIVGRYRSHLLRVRSIAGCLVAAVAFPFGRACHLSYHLISHFRYCLVDRGGSCTRRAAEAVCLRRPTFLDLDIRSRRMPRIHLPPLYRELDDLAVVPIGSTS